MGTDVWYITWNYIRMLQGSVPPLYHQKKLCYRLRILGKWGTITFEQRSRRHSCRCRFNLDGQSDCDRWNFMNIAKDPRATLLIFYDNSMFHATMIHWEWLFLWNLISLSSMLTWLTLWQVIKRLHDRDNQKLNHENYILRCMILRTSAWKINHQNASSHLWDM